MAMRIVANRPDPAILGLPWHLPLEDWPDDVVVPLPRGLSRHVVRIVRLRDQVYAVKETQDDIAFREYRMLRDLQRINMPAVLPQGVVTGREDADGEGGEAEDAERLLAARDRDAVEHPQQHQRRDRGRGECASDEARHRTDPPAPVRGAPQCYP